MNASTVDAVRGLVHGRLTAILRCYERELLATPSLYGRIDARIRIDASGQVTLPRMHGMEASSVVRACTDAELRALDFPASQQGSVRVNVTFTFNLATRIATHSAPSARLPTWVRLRRNSPPRPIEVVREEIGWTRLAPATL